ncbi:MAG TPA: general secretion pathway protein GspB [Woeseiaceae bacterium]|jgi:general secretion pathway protein B|nr:general secretion pathway protein GspB [Woeseiaceae bacterium]
MSFILDALKKSETDRQQQGSAEFAGIPTSSRRREGPPGWLWLIGALLIINLAVLIGLWLRPDVGGPSGPTQVAAPGEPAGASGTAVDVEDAPTESATTGSFANRVEAARQNAPAQQESAVDEVAEKAPVARVTIEPATALMLPTYQEVQARGLINAAPLHVDIHVYSETADDRFVFVNMAKHTEGSRLKEGPVVEEIVPEGVILEMDGTRFLLPRD